MSARTSPLVHLQLGNLRSTKVNCTGREAHADCCSPLPARRCAARRNRGTGATNYRKGQRTAWRPKVHDDRGTVADEGVASFTCRAAPPPNLQIPPQPAPLLALDPRPCETPSQHGIKPALVARRRRRRRGGGEVAASRERRSGRKGVVRQQRGVSRIRSVFGEYGVKGVSKIDSPYMYLCIYIYMLFLENTVLRVLVK